MKTLKTFYNGLDSLALCGVGGLLIAIGEGKGAFDGKKGGTISEWFWKLPPAVQFFLIWCMGVIFCHFIGWGRVINTTIEEVKASK